MMQQRPALCSETKQYLKKHDLRDNHEDPASEPATDCTRRNRESRRLQQSNRTHDGPSWIISQTSRSLSLSPY